MQFKYFILLILLPMFSFGQQGKVKIVVVDGSTKSPISGASVSIVTPTAKAFLKGQQTSTEGVAEIDQVNPGTYAVQVSYVGYANYIKDNVIVRAGQTLDLGITELVDEKRAIDEVVIQGRTPELQLGIDKKIFDVSQSTISTGGTAQDLLGNVPTLQVDAEGNVSLRGSNVRILIDGKESAMAGGDVTRLLQSLPADVISKVEIITNPSAKYDAEGQTGIVNIVLKKNMRTGFNGTVTTSAGNYDNYMAGIDLNYRDTKFNYFGGYNFNHRQSVGERTTRNVGLIDGQETAASQVTNTDVENSRLGKNHSIRFGADYFAAENTTLSVASNVSIRDNDRKEDILYSYRNVPGFGTLSPRTSRQSEQDLGYDISFDFKQGLKREGEELSANVTYGNDSEDGTNDYFQTYDNGRDRDERKNITSEAGKNWNFQLDYVLPLGENHKLEAGYRTMLRNSDESQLSDTLLPSGVFGRDYRVSNDFVMNSGVHALYVNYQRMLTERLGAQLGLRAEDAYLNTTLTDFTPGLSEEERVTKGPLDYFRVYPSLFLTYDVNDEGDKVQLNYSRRVQRPRGWQVNPFVNLSDETNLRQGNPLLMPEDIHAVELSFAKFYDNWNFISSAYYRRVNDMVQPIQYGLEDPIAEPYLLERPNRTFSRWENVGNRNNLGVEVISKVTINKWWDATGNLNVFYNRINANTNFNNISVSNYSWSSNLTTNVKIRSSLSAQVRGEYRSSMKTVQGTFKSMSGVDLAIRQDVLKGKGSLVFNVRDVFDKRRFGSETILPARYIDSNMRWNKRTFGLTFSYRFGIQDLSKSKNQENMPMDDGGGGEF